MLFQNIQKRNRLPKMQEFMFMVCDVTPGEADVTLPGIAFGQFHARFERDIEVKQFQFKRNTV
jgi:hypothetical protein